MWFIVLGTEDSSNKQDILFFSTIVVFGPFAILWYNSTIKLLIRLSELSKNPVLHPYVSFSYFGNIFHNSYPDDKEFTLLLKDVRTSLITVLVLFFLIAIPIFYFWTTTSF